MTVIRPNSISGVTSITAQSQSIEFYKSDGNLSGANLDGVNINTAGILTAANFKTGSSNLHSTGLTVGNNFLHTTGINVGTGATIHVPSSNVLTLGTNNNERLRIDSSGRALIGTTTEGHAEGDDLTIATSGVTGITIRSGTSSAGNIFFSDATSGSAERQGILRYDHADDAMKFNVNNSERLRITSAGYLNIGTDLTNSTYLVSSRGVGHNRVEIMSTDNNSAGIYLRTFNSGSQVSSATVRTDNSGNLQFYTAASGSEGERLRITSGGAIGLSGANYGTSGQVLTSGGSGSAATWSTVSGTTINSNADNRVITGSGTANTLNAEGNFLHDASTCDTTIQHYEALKVVDLIVKNTNNHGNAAGARITIESGSAANTGPQFQMICGSHKWSMQVPKAAGNLEFNNNGTLDFLMADDGDFHVVDGDIVFSTAGHGIDFSATSDASGGTSELLDDYEEGTWTPTLVSAPGGASIGSATGYYTKVGNMCTLWLQSVTISGNNSSNNTIQVGGIPFSCASGFVATGIPRGYGVYRNSNHTWVTFLDSGNNIMWGQLDENVAWTQLKYSGLQNTSGHVVFQITLTYKTT